MASSRGTVGGRLLEQLLHIEQGAAKHGSDPTFPDLSRVCNIPAVREALMDALMNATASKTKVRSDAGLARAQETQATVLVAKLVSQIQGWAGKRSDVLKDFGLHPHKQPRKRGARSGATAGKSTRRGATPKAESPGGSSTPAGAAEPPAGGDPAGSTTAPKAAGG